MSRTGALNPKGDQQITVSSTAIGLTVPSGANHAIIQVKNAAIYYTEDGVTPSSSNGLEADNDYILNYMDADYRGILGKFLAISQTADATLKVMYYD